MEAYLWQPSLLEQRLEGSLDEVLGINRRADASGEDQITILVEARASYPLFELSLAVGFEGVHRTGRKVDLSPATPGFGLTY
jgi:hypothetical protein